MNDFQAQIALANEKGSGYPLYSDFEPVMLTLMDLRAIIRADKARLGTLYEVLTNPVWSPGYTEGSDIAVDCSGVMQPLTMVNWLVEDGGGAGGYC